MPKILLILVLLLPVLCFCQQPGVYPNGSGSSSTNSGQALTPATPLAPLWNGLLYGKLVINSGDSTTSVSELGTQTMCQHANKGQELEGVSCAAAYQYSVDGSNNVTVSTVGNLPSNCLVGGYVTIDATSTFASNSTGSTTPTFIITGTTSSSVTFNNSFSSGSVSLTTANGVITCSVLNDGSNGQTQAGFNTTSGIGQGGVGSLTFVTSLKPDLDIHVMGVNDVRGGTVSQSQLQALYTTYIQSIRAASPKTAIVLATPNTLLANDPTSSGWVTSASTTSTTAVSPGSVAITLAAMPNSISGLVTTDLTLAQEAANSYVAATPTTGTINASSGALAVTSATGLTPGVVITVAGAGISGATLTTQIQTVSGNNLTVAPQASTSVVGAAVAQSGTTYSAHLLIDSGASQEIVPITAISGNTVTATFALSHSGTYTVIPTMATMAQAYTNIMHDAVMSFENQYSNVQVADTQSHVYGRLVQIGPTPLVTNQLHPTILGYDWRSHYIISVLNKDNLSGGSHGTVAVAGIPTAHYGAVSAYSPTEAISAMNSSYNTCWLYYPQCVENPDYYTLVGEGVLNAYGTGFVDVAGEPDLNLFGSTVYGVIPGQGYDLIEFVNQIIPGGVGIVQTPASPNFTLTGSNTQITIVGTIPWTLPISAQGSETAIRIYRAKYVDPTAETYAKNPLLYKTKRYVNVNNVSTTAFYFNFLAAEPNLVPSPSEQAFNPATDKLVVQGVGDLSSIITGYSSMTCTYNIGQWYCSGGSNVPAMTNGYGEAFYTDSAEIVDRNFIAKNKMFSPEFISSGSTATLSGCSYTSAVGGASAGKFASGTNGTCTVAITLPTAPNGWSCWANDITTPADVLHQSVVSATGATITGTTVTSDVINWGCVAY